MFQRCVRTGMQNRADYMDGMMLWGVIWIAKESSLDLMMIALHINILNNKIYNNRENIAVTQRG